MNGTVTTLLAVAAAVVAAGRTAAGADPYPDPLLTTPASPANVAKGLEVDGYHLGVSAYTWGYPLVRMERVAREYTDVPAEKSATSYRAPLNRIGWATALATPAAKDMPTANNDTVYLSAMVDLTEPYVLRVPDVADRYYVVNAFNMWQELEHYVGRRVTGTKAGKFAYVPPGWKGELPADVKRLDVTTSKIWLWGRLRVSPADPPKDIRAIQEGFDLRPLSALGKADWKTPTAMLPPMPDITSDELGFFSQLSFALTSNPVRKTDEALFGQFARIGLTGKGFDPSKLNDAQRKGLVRALQDGPLVAIAAVPATSEVRNGWNYVRGLDDFGYNYALRAGVAGPYLGGQGEKEAVYPVRYTDSKGDTLTGRKNYVVRFSSMPPNDAFWSLTMYDAQSKMLIANEIDRYKVGSDTAGLKARDDGSFEIPISHAKPTGDFAGNWLPAPEGEFYLILRIYQPKESVLSGTWQLPNVETAR